MRKLIPVFLLALIIQSMSLVASARQLSISEAVNNANTFLSSGNITPLGTGKHVNNLKLVYQAENQLTNQSLYYIFDRNDNDGFIIVSADDRLRPILGYSMSDSFDPNVIPENMKWWLEEYEREIEAYLKEMDNCRIVPTGSTTFYPFPAVDHEPIISPLSTTLEGHVKQLDSHEPLASYMSGRIVAPLMSTLWNQGEPFNNMCPLDGSNRSVTGCVATAMAQIMNYHKWPQGPGTGSYSYTTEKGTDVSFDFSSTIFDWNNMVDNYRNSTSEIQKSAVATLMLACGASVKMDYTASESGAQGYITPWALVKYFGYDKEARIIPRIGYTVNEWNEIVYNELINERPVFYTGRSDKGGHAFVCDGYDGNGYFHINWGWGGYQDNYFALSALNPSGQGIGGYVGGYNSGQHIGIGIQPPVSQNSDAMGFTVVAEADFTYTGNSNFVLNGSIYTEYMEDARFYFAVEAVPEGTTGPGMIFISNNLATIKGGDPTIGYYWYSRFNFNAPVNGLKQGSYKIYPAYMNENQTEWHRIHCPFEKQTYVKLTVNPNGEYVYTNDGTETSADLLVKNFTPDGSVYANKATKFSFEIENKGTADYNDIVKLSVRRPGETQVLYSYDINVNVGASKTSYGTLTLTFELEPGTYETIFTDASDNLIIDSPFPLEISENTTPDQTESIWVSVYANNALEFYQNYSSTVGFIMTNLTEEDTEFNINFNFCEPDGYQILLRLNSSIVLPPGSYLVNFRGFHTGMLGAGKYDLILTDSNGSIISDRHPVYVYEEVDRLWFCAEDGEARVVAPPVDPYSGTVTIPADVTLSGTQYPVTKVLDNTFDGGIDITALFFKSEAVPFTSPASLFKDIPESTDIYVPSVAYNEYFNEFGNLGHNVYSTIESLKYQCIQGDMMTGKIGDKIKIRISPIPANVHINPNFNIVIPYDILNIISELPDGTGNIDVEFEAAKCGSDNMTVYSAQTGVKELTIPFNIIENSSVDHVSIKGIKISTGNNMITVTGIGSGDSIMVYDMKGSLVSVCHATSDIVTIPLSSGLYIIRIGSIITRINI